MLILAMAGEGGEMLNKIDNKIDKRKLKNILWFNEVNKNDIPIVGGKGANLGELTQVGVPVPKGFIVTSLAYFTYLKANRLDGVIKKLLASINPEDSKKLQSIALQIQKLILNTPLPQSLKLEIEKAYKEMYTTVGGKIFVAVRSSATAEDLPGASFAGQQATFLNISGGENVVKAVLRCWASLFEARAIYYRANGGFDHMKVGIAVPVQTMIQSDKSGIMFTIDPVSNNKNVLVIDAGFGLGEAIVSGSITPDRYVVDKKEMKILDKEINQQTWKIAKIVDSEGVERDAHVIVPDGKQKMQKITDDQIIEIAKMGKMIEDHYGFPQDTEWALEKTQNLPTGQAGSELKAQNFKLWFVQSRPVTTIKKNVPITETDKGPVKQNKEEIILKGASASIGIASGPVKIIHKPTDIDQVEPGDVLVTEMTTPDFVPAMKRAKAIITDTGGRTCHAAIISRELGIPCVVGTGTATHDLKTGQVVTVDGANGLVYKGKIALSKEMKLPQSTKEQIRYRQEIPITGTKVYVNLADVDQAEKIAAQPVDGVGLLRAEFMIAAIGEHPKSMIENGRQQEFIDKLANDLKRFTQAFSPRPVIYRATDFKTNEYRNLKGGEKFEPREENPMIGYRGCLRYVKDPAVFNLELEAIKKVRNMYDGKNLHLMIPFVRTVHELAEVKKLIEASGLEQGPNFKLWMMCEVPSNVILLEDFLKLGIDGVSIGSNDLTQLILGCDRDNQTLAEEFDERDPAVVKAVKFVIHTCKKYNVTCSICGQAPSTYPEYTEMLVEAGVTSVSINPDMIVPTRQLIASIERRLMLKQVVK
jgi:pyruvate,water dikinase